MESLKNLIGVNRFEGLTNTGIELATNVLIAALILIVGLWIAKRIQNLIVKLSKKSPHLDETLFKFLASIAKFVVMA